MSNNVVVLQGKIYKWEISGIKGGHSIGKFAIGVSNGTKTPSKSFFNVEIWEPSGELTRSLTDAQTSGKKVVVIGKLKQDQWETKEGVKKSNIKIVANTVSVVSAQDSDESESEKETIVDLPKKILAAPKTPEGLGTPAIQPRPPFQSKPTFPPNTLETEGSFRMKSTPVPALTQNLPTMKAEAPVTSNTGRPVPQWSGPDDWAKAKRQQQMQPAQEEY